MYLILLGAPGAGKGTQAVELSKILKVPHISTGDIFRDNIKAKTELGVIADSYISKGKLVPDDVTTNMVDDRISQEDCKNGFILDGFPRTIAQAEALEKILGKTKSKLLKVLNIVISEDVVLRRLSQRRICPNCKRSYHLEFDPPHGDICYSCGAKVVQRPDDVPDVIKQRLITYNESTKPLIDFYRSKGSLVNVQSENDIDESLQNSLYALGLKGI
ncbi:MAG: adenylate kinase [Ruminococcaceae bacterium]|nr:adenylate kinase [Oscillospiraceae bacterium]